MAFWQVALGWTLVSVVVQLLRGFGVVDAPFVTVIVNVVILGYLAWYGRDCARRRAAGFDAVIAAEILVAFGIFSLVLGLATSLLPIILGDRTQAELLSFDGMRELGYPFFEGLMTAACAPLAAVFLRASVSAEQTDAPEVENAVQLGRAFAELVQQVGSVRLAVADLRSAVELAGSGTREAAQGLVAEAEQQRRMLTDATRSLGEKLGAVDQALGESGQKLVQGIDGSVRALTSSTEAMASGLERLPSRLAAAVEGSVQALDRLGGSVAPAAEQLELLNLEAARLRSASAEATVLLESLADVIRTVKSFVPAEPATPQRNRRAAR